MEGLANVGGYVRVGGGDAASHGRREQAEPTGGFGLGGWRKKKTRDRRYTTDVGCQSNGW